MAAPRSTSRAGTATRRWCCWLRRSPAKGPYRDCRLPLAGARAAQRNPGGLQKLEQKREERRNEKPADKLVRYTGDLMSALAVDAVDPERAVKTLRKLNGLELTADDFQQEQVLACAKNVKKCRKFANEAVQSAAADVWATWKAKIAAE